VPYKDEFGNWRSAENLVMKGDEVFMFVMKKVPSLINSILEVSGTNKDEVDYYMFHQPNRFMLNKLAQKLKIPRDKMPSQILLKILEIHQVLLFH
jgi:3-oxoacyl-[acyl-carrier-protein] synthase-3